MSDTDLIKLHSYFPTECARIMFLYNRDGMESTHEWVTRTYHGYRDYLKHARKSKRLSSHYHREFILACIDFRFFLQLYRKAVDLTPNSM